MPSSNATKEERELKIMLEQQGFYVVRSAGSLAVDLLAVKDGVPYAIEVKARGSKLLYLNQKGQEQIRQMLKLWSNKIIPILAIKFKGTKAKPRGWNFIKIREEIRGGIGFRKELCCELW